MKDIIKNKLGLKYYDENNNIKNNKIQRNNNDYIRQNNIIQHDINENLRQSSNPNIHWPILSLMKKSNYPHKTPLLSLLERWNPNDLNIPQKFVEVLQHFDFENLEQRRASVKYRNNNVPYKLYNISDINKASKLWNNDYILQNLKEIKVNGELINNDEKTNGYNHTQNKFLYGTIKNNKRKHITIPSISAAPHINFEDFMKLSESNNTDYYYVIKSPPKDTNSFISKDLQIWSSTAENYFITNPKANHGTKCKISMKGGMTEAHYHTARNMMASIRGSLRVQLFSLTNCHLLINNTTRIIKKNNIIDWNNLEDLRKRGFDTISSLETIVLPGELLLIPPSWLYTIISLDYSIECNLVISNPTNQNTYFPIDHCVKHKVHT
jgi:hypothetical protein